MKILIIGCNSVLGQVVSIYCIQKKHDVYGMDYKNIYRVDFSRFYDIKIARPFLKDIHFIISSERFDAIINCSAMLIKESENNPEEAAFVNSDFPHFLESVTKESDTIIVHRSTDCIFSGKKGNYTLEDKPDGCSVYAKTKVLGELNNNKDITIRTSLIGPDRKIDAPDLFGWFNNTSKEVKGFSNSIWTGLTTIEFAREALCLIEKKAHGIFQCVPEHAISKYELLLLFEKYFPKNRRIVKVFNERNDKSLKQELGNYKLHIPSYEEQIKEMKEWIKEQYSTKKIYSHYMED